MHTSKKGSKGLLHLAVLGISLAGPAAFAAPINGTGNVTPDAIFGGGNANGSFTGVNQSGVELGLRGKLRYNTSGVPEDTFNYDGDRTYTFTVAESNAPANRSAFNFEWSINVDSTGTTSNSLDDFTYQLRIDYNPTISTDFVTFDPINVPFADHSIGTNATGNGDGVEAANATEYATLIANNNVAQNSWNPGFFFIFPIGFDPQTQGLYTIELAALTNGNEIASTTIDIIYGDVPAVVPLPATLPMLLLGLFGAAHFSYRRKMTS